MDGGIGSWKEDAWKLRRLPSNLPSSILLLPEPTPKLVGVFPVVTGLQCGWVDWWMVAPPAYLLQVVPDLETASLGKPLTKHLTWPPSLALQQKMKRQRWMGSVVGVTEHRDTPTCSMMPACCYEKVDPCNACVARALRAALCLATFLHRPRPAPHFSFWRS